MTISRRLLDEIAAVCPPDDRPRLALQAPVAEEEEEDGPPVPPPPIRIQYGRRGPDPTTRDRVLDVLREHSPIAQREVFWRIVRAVGGEPGTLRSRVSHELTRLEEHGQARRCRPPKDVDQKQVWWEVQE